MFENKVLIVGYGSVSKCTLPILLEHIEIPRKNITIIDFEDKTRDLKDWTSSGITFKRNKITKKNLNQVLSENLSKGDLLIDLAWNIGANDILGWCHRHNVLYANTSVEQWNPAGAVFTDSPFEKSLYHRHMQLREMSKNWKNSSTAIVEHGANPGLISHFTKQALVDISYQLIEDEKISREKARNLEDLIKNKKFGEVAMNLGVKVIHCSERDTQISDKPKEVNEFVGTWSIEGLREEGTAPAELGWGTHEKELPSLTHLPSYGPKNQIFLAQMGINTWVRSWVPCPGDKEGYEIVGMVIRHGEAFGISDRFTVKDKKGKVIYRPTVNYAYQPCDNTIMSLHELRSRNYEMQPKLRIMGDDVTKGEDILGALVMGHKYKSWWTGSILDIKEARRLLPGQNATTIQVALGVVSAVKYMIENPREGILLPDDLPHDYVLEIAKPYLGEFVSRASDWTPLKNRKIYFKENPQSRADKKNIWQFKNFLLVP